MEGKRTAQAYYNENDPFAAQWLRNLITAEHITPGTVDERSIVDVRAKDLAGYGRVHLFGGAGGWDLALNLAGWAGPVWTGSCPCTPFSCAGKRKGEKDARHLWPEMLRLIEACRPGVVFGEQVASAEVVGTQLEAAFVVAVQNGDYARANKFAKRLAQSSTFHYWARWVDGIQRDLAEIGYAFRFKILGAHSVQAPHIRQRLYWVADPNSIEFQQVTPSRQQPEYEQDGGVGGLANANRAGYPELSSKPQRVASTSGVSRLGNASRDNEQRNPESPVYGKRFEAGGPSRPVGLGDPGDGQLAQPTEQPARPERQATSGTGGIGPWDAYEFIPCRDGCVRRIECGTFPLAYGLPRSVGLVQSRLQGVAALAANRRTLGLAKKNRVERLKGYGNSLCIPVAVEFIRAYMETTKCQPR